MSDELILIFKVFMTFIGGLLMGVVIGAHDSERILKLLDRCLSKFKRAE